MSINRNAASVRVWAGGSKVSGPRGSRHLGGSRPLSVPVCQRTSLHQVSKVTIHPSPATPEDSRLALAPPFLSAPQIQHSAPPPPPNKCYSSCIFNLLSDAIILYTPCSLILMQLLLFIVGLFYPLILFHSTPPPGCLSAPVYVHVCSFVC